MLKQDHALSLGPQLAKCFDFHFSSDQYVAFFSVSSISTDWDNQASLDSTWRLHLDILLLWPVKRSYEIVGFGHCNCHYNCHSDRQFCVCSKIYIPPFVGWTTRPHNQARETRLTGGSHRRMASTMMWVHLISSVLPSFVVYDNCIFRSPTQMTALSECLVDFSFSLLLLNFLLTLSYCACGCLKSAQKPWNSSIRRLFCRSISTQRTKGKHWKWGYFVRLVPYGWRIFLLLPQTEHRFAVDCFR